MGFWADLFGTHVNLDPGAGGDIYIRDERTFCEKLEDAVRDELEADKVQQAITKKWSACQDQKIFPCRDYQLRKIELDVLWAEIIVASNIHLSYLQTLEYLVQQGDTVIVKVDDVSYHVENVATPLGGNMVTVTKSSDFYRRKAERLVKIENQFRESYYT